MAPFGDASLMKFFAVVRCLVVLAQPMFFFAAGHSRAVAQGIACGAASYQVASEHSALPLYVEPDSPDAIRLAAIAFAGDVEKLTGTRPRILDSLDGVKEAVVVGLAGESRELDAMLAKGGIEDAELKGRWESSLRVVVNKPGNGLDRALIIAGSDRRGAAFALFDLSRSWGVSPWTWWADVPVAHRTSLCVDARQQQTNEPSVRYRGIFLNDEDWGLRPWAAQKMDAALGNIGPHTYERVFELLLRLGANTLWPAMHPGTLAFNAVAENARLADRWGIVMGSSHSEALLRNNVGEWDERRDGPWNYQTNRAAIDRYWLERLRVNGRFENFYTVGMRGVHDTGLEASGTPAEKAHLVEDVMQSQRKMLGDIVHRNVEELPQVIWLYKESLELYRAGMRVPDDVTLGWTDDNYGYLRQLSTSDEQRRKGGSAVYYHVSYWGFPHDYLWLCSTPPSLIGEEMTKAYEHGARRLWILNVGDIKPAEVDIDYFLQLARSEEATSKLSEQAYLERWYGEQLGAEHGADAAAIMQQYFALNFVRRPEFMAFNGYNDDVHRTSFNPLAWGDENRRRLQAWRSLAMRSEQLAAQIDKAHGDAFFELVGYPVAASEAINEKFLATDRSYLDAVQKNEKARAEDATRAEKAYQRIVELTAEYNSLAHGKWQGMMDARPRNRHVFDAPKPAQRDAVFDLPAQWAASNKASSAHNCTEKFCEADGVVSINAAHFSARQDAHAASWQVLEELGISGASVRLPLKDAASEAVAAEGGWVEYRFATADESAARLELYWLPVFPVDAAHRLRYLFAIDDGALQKADLAGMAEWSENSAPAWEQNVLRNAAVVSVPTGPLQAGSHTVRIWPLDPGLVLEHVVMRGQGAAPFYPVPTESVINLR